MMVAVESSMMGGFFNVGLKMFLIISFEKSGVSRVVITSSPEGVERLDNFTSLFLSLFGDEGT